MSEATHVGQAAPTEPDLPTEPALPVVPAQSAAPAPPDAARTDGKTSSPAHTAAPGDVAPIAEVDELSVPQLADGVALCGRYEGVGYTEPRYLIARADGQMILVSELLYLVASHIDGRRDLRQVAERVTAAGGAEISASGVGYLVNDKLHRLGVAALDETVAEAPHADPLISLAMRGVLLPAGGVRKLAAVLAPLFQPVIVVSVLCAMVVADVALVASGSLDPAFHASVGDPAHVLMLLALIVTSTFFHESGHAAACHYGGARPGAIGFGILLIFPAFYTNVTDAYRLDRAGRLRTDLGGLYFNAIYILAVAGLFWATGFAPLAVFIVLSHVQMLQQLLPLIRLDGYYILGDLVGVPNLFAHVRPFLRKLMGKQRPGEQVGAGLRPQVRLLVTCWVAVVVPMLFLAVVMLFLRIPRYLGTALQRGHDYWISGLDAFGQGSVLAGLLAVLSLFVLLLPWMGGIAFTIRAGRQLGRWYRRKHPRHIPRHRAPVTRNRFGLRTS
ncbi:hypothetical protein [Saccharopolyspora gloriosae]|uniref:hypothetical protein n=1 Tax=Saccharopolyspora gloriosae TaxID=455344 RepID=UPI001FB77037|nr:hypothetical protein [Saccharopolyspora gloriosae]